uniref:Uncharacterized protein n=1 Tax=Anguilla anguilla TaxID=7936 RepID=A0A0E9UKK7_ANGAN
MGKSGGCILTI